MGIVFSDPAHGRAIAKHAGTSFNPEVDQVIARVKNDVLLGGVIYTSYTGRTISLHMAGFERNWCNLDMLWVCYDYPFNQLKCDRIFGHVPSDKQEALEIDLKLGFKIEVTVPDVYPNADLIVVSMRREDCRWLRLNPPLRRKMEGRDGRQELGTEAA